MCASPPLFICARGLARIDQRPGRNVVVAVQHEVKAMLSYKRDDVCAVSHPVPPMREVSAARLGAHDRMVYCEQLDGQLR
mmetsp:Transcript_6506/g.17407  ORF Transcript_6506/g.17407 Transcript_6506/m.17407 type:complete len:80 (+) Transcript_6506:1833-2072(+)